MKEERLVARVREFGSEVGELREDLVDDPDRTAERVGVDIFGKEASQVALIEFVSRHQVIK